MSREEVFQPRDSWDDAEELSRHFSVVSKPFVRLPHRSALKAQNGCALLASSPSAGRALNKLTSVSTLAHQLEKEMRTERRHGLV